MDLHLFTVCPSAHCLSSSHLDYLFFLSLFFKISDTRGQKKALWALILYLSTMTTKRVCPRRTSGFISNLQCDTREGPSHRHTWWDTCMSSAARGLSPTAGPHAVTQAATALSAVSISSTSRCNCVRVNTWWSRVFYSLVCPCLQKQDMTHTDRLQAGGDVGNNTWRRS